MKWALDVGPQEWELWAKDKGLAPFVGKQVAAWIFEKGVLDPLAFSNVPSKVRENLLQSFSWAMPTTDGVWASEDGSEKILLKLHDGQLIEMVVMPSPNRVTLCVSSQVGCRMGCTFCQTGRMGLRRNLSSGEIVAQVLLANQRLAQRGLTRRVTNVVFMGMGEPLDNLEAVVTACRLFTGPMGLSKHRVTVSTSGLVPEIEQLGQEVGVSLAISLHSADDAERSALMPVNRRWPLDQLKQALLKYPVATRHGITFEYVMIAGKNDSLAHARKLVRFVHGLKAKVNLIPMNPHPGTTMEASGTQALRDFQQYLSTRSIPAPVRYSRGQDVSGACGQLVMKRQGEGHLPPRQVVRARLKDMGPSHPAP